MASKTIMTQDKCGSVDIPGRVSVTKADLKIHDDRIRHSLGSNASDQKRIFNIAIGKLDAG